MLVKTVYREVILYVLVPLFVVLCLFGLIMFLRSRVNLQETDREKIYHANFWSAVIGIIFGAILQAVSIGFSVAFIEKIQSSNLAGNYQFLTVILTIFPFVPFLFLIYAISKFVRTIRDHAIIEKTVEDYEEAHRTHFF